MNANPLDGGVCRRHAPTLAEGPGWYRGWPRKLPPVDVGDFCGDFQPASPADAPPLRRRERKRKGPQAAQADDPDAATLQPITECERRRLGLAALNRAA